MAKKATKATVAAAVKTRKESAMEKELKQLMESINALNATLKGIGINAAPEKVEAKKGPSKAQLEARAKFAANAKAAAERRATFKSPEYTTLWEAWKKKKAKAYAKAETKAAKKELNQAGHKWVMAELVKKSA